MLTWSAQPGLSRREFYWHRFARVWPFHALTAVIAGVAYSFGSVFTTLSVLLLFQAWDPSSDVHYGLLGASWSLSAEAFFYALWPLSVAFAVKSWRWFATTSLVVFATGAVVTGGFIATGAGSWTDAAYVNPAMRLGEFLIGVALAVAFQRGWGPQVPMWLAVVFLAASWELCRMRYSEDFPMPDYLLTPGFALLIWASAQADRGRVRGVLRHRWLVYAGQASFALYLVHQFAIRAVAHLDAPDALRAPLMVIAAVVFALAGHELVEKPANRRLRRYGAPSFSDRQGSLS